MCYVSGWAHAQTCYASAPALNPLHTLAWKERLMVPTTEWYWKALLIVATVVAVGWFLFRVNQLLQFTLMGVDSYRFNHWGTRFKMLAVYVLGQLRMYNRRVYTVAGVAHFFTFW